MGRYLELIRGRLEAVQGSSNPQIPQKSVSPHTVGEETGVGSGSVVSCEKSELSEIRVCACDQWETFPCDPNKQCPICQTPSICKDCGGCRWCWWLAITGQVSATR